MEVEIESPTRNETWDIVARPDNVTPIRSNRVYEIKRDDNEFPYRFKARLVAVGSSHIEGIDFDDVSSRVCAGKP